MKIIAQETLEALCCGDYDEHQVTGLLDKQPGLANFIFDNNINQSMTCGLFLMYLAIEDTR